MLQPIHDTAAADGDDHAFVHDVDAVSTAIPKTRMSDADIATVKYIMPRWQQPHVANRSPHFDCQEEETTVASMYQPRGDDGCCHDFDDNADCIDVHKHKGDDAIVFNAKYKQFGDTDDQHRVSLSAPRHSLIPYDGSIGPNAKQHHPKVEQDLPRAMKPTEALLAALPMDDHKIHQSTTATPNREDVPRQVSQSGDTVVAISIDEAEVRRRHEEDIFKHLPEAEVLPNNRKRRRLKRICIATIVLGIVVVAVVLIASLVGRDNDDDDGLVKKTLPPWPTQAPTTTLFVPNDFSQHNATAAIGDQLVAAPNHTLLVSYLIYFDVLNFMNYATNITLFAPTDESFQNLWKDEPFSFYPNETSWYTHFGLLMDTLAVREELNTSQIFAMETLPSYPQGVELTVNRANVTIENGASIVVADVLASNGYIQVPDRVILIERFRQTLFEWVLDSIHDSPTFTLHVFRQLISFVPALDQAVLQLNLNAGLTLLAPTDAAFASVYPDITEFLLTPGAENATQDLINYHMVLFNTYTGLIVSLREFNVPSLNSLVSVWFTANLENETFVNHAKILESQVLQNGVLHIIDQVLKAPRMGELLELTTNVTMNFHFATFLHIVQGPAHLDDLFTSTENRTVFAPLEIAFEAHTDLITRLLRSEWLLHLQSLVRHHFMKNPVPSAAGNYEIPMQSGFNLSLQIYSNGSVAADDIPSEDIVDAKHLHSVNGIFYVVGDLLLPPWIGHSIFDNVVQDTDFSTLASLLDRANLSRLLNSVSDAPMTLLAPSNAAFTALGPLTNFNTTTSRSMLDLLLGHIFAGNLYSTEMNDTVVALNNRTWNVHRAEGRIYIGGALLFSLDNLASNGLVHGIDRVLQISNVFL